MIISAMLRIIVDVEKDRVLERHLTTWCDKKLDNISDRLQSSNGCNPFFERL